jgi:hypothetical protein
MSKALWSFLLAGLIGLNVASLGAATITYSWSGTLLLHENSPADPWGIGADGAPFTLSTTVAAAALDDNPTQTPWADFAALSARLRVDGEEIPFVSSARIDFSDSADVLDAVSAVGEFSKGGQALFIASVVALPPAAFSLSLPSESPPFIASMVTAGRATNASRPYVAIVAPGTWVSVVPEPHAHWLGLLCFGAVLARHRPSLQPHATSPDLVGSGRPREPSSK